MNRWHICIMVINLAIKKNKSMNFAGKWMLLESIIFMRWPGLRKVKTASSLIWGLNSWYSSVYNKGVWKFGSTMQLDRRWRDKQDWNVLGMGEQMGVCEMKVERNWLLGVGEYRGETMRLGRRGGAEKKFCLKMSQWNPIHCKMIENLEKGLTRWLSEWCVKVLAVQPSGMS